MNLPVVTLKWLPVVCREALLVAHYYLRVMVQKINSKTYRLVYLVMRYLRIAFNGKNEYVGIFWFFPSKCEFGFINFLIASSITA